MTLTSICIPTRNRADYLDFLLGEIAKFEHLNYEVVVSDNASDDDTPAVVMRWRSELKNLYYIRQSNMISGPENACAVCNAARGDYIFRISDDDLVVEEGLIAAQSILDTEPSCTAVYPRWHICDSTLEQIQTVVHYGSDAPLIRNDTSHLEDASPHKPIRVMREQALEMYERFWTVELPVFRRDIFQSHIGFVSNQLPLDFFAAAQFLKYGDIYFIWDLCAKIRQHADQDSGALHSPRVLEAYTSDYEQFLACLPELDPSEAMRAFYAKMIRQYIISTQFAVQSGDFLRALEIVRKTLAFRVPGVAEFAAEFEKLHGPAIVAKFIAQAISVAPNVKRLIIEDCDAARQILPLLKPQIEPMEISWVSGDDLIDSPHEAADFVVAATQMTMRARLARSKGNPARHRSLDQIRDACRAVPG